MKIKDMYQKDITRSINPVVNVDADEVVKQEVDEYVITADLRKYFSRFFDAYSETKMSSDAQIGVWISGFFGSGKSHFLKMLSYILENKIVDGNPMVEIFDKKFGDKLSIMSMDKCAINPSETILFNISAKSPMSGKSNHGVLKAFSTVFFEHMGFYGSNLKVAQLEFHLSKIGKLDEFINTVNQYSKLDWLAIRKSSALHAPAILYGLQKVMGLNETQANKWLDDNSSDNYSIANFVDDVKEYVDAKPGRRLVFMADEVGQYVGSDIDKLLELQTISEELAVTCKGRVWLVCTAQEGLDEVIKVRTNEFSRIQDRFTTRISLSSSSVDEVIQKRLLLKTDNAEKLLAQIYTANDSAYKNLFTFKGTAHDFRGHVNEKEFVLNFPFVSYQYTTVQNIYTEVRKSGNTGTHLAGGERSLLSAFHQAVLAVQDDDEFAIVPLYRFYGPIETYLDSSITQVFTRCNNSIRDGSGLEPGDDNVLKLLYLLRYAENIPTNFDNIVILMADNITVDTYNLKNRIAAALDRLMAENYISKTDEIYTFLNDQEQKIARDIKAVAVPNATIVDRIGKKIFGEIYQPKKFNFKGNNFDIDAKVDDNVVYGFNSEMSIQIFTDAANPVLTQDLKLASDSYKKVIVVLGTSKYYSVIEGCLQVDMYIKGRNIKLLPESEQKIIKGHRDQANTDDGKAKLLLEDALRNGKYYVNGSQIQVKADSASACIEHAFEMLAASVYSDIGLIDSPFNSDTDIVAVLKGQMQVTVDGKKSNADACKKISEYVEMRYKTNISTSVADIQNMFSKKPYGWKEIDIAGVLAQLVVEHTVEIKRAGVLIQPNDNKLCDFLRKKSEIGFTSVVWHIPIPSREIEAAKETLFELFKAMDIPSDETKLSEYIIERFEKLLKDYEGLQVRYQGHSYPEKHVVEKAISVVNGVLYQKKDNKALIRKVGLDKDELVLRIKNMKHIIEFFSNQVKLFDYAESFLDDISIDRAFLKKDDSAAKSIADISEILERSGNQSSDKPYDYNRIPELNVLTQTVRNVREKMCGEKRAEAKIVAEQCLDSVRKHSNATEHVDIVNEAERRIEGIMDRINASDCISEINNMFNELTVCMNDAIKAMDNLVPVPGGEGGDGPTKPSVSYVKVFKTATFPNKIIKNEAELDAYLDKIRIFLLEKIRENDGIDLC